MPHRGILREGRGSVEEPGLGMPQAPSPVKRTGQEPRGAATFTQSCCHSESAVLPLVGRWSDPGSHSRPAGGEGRTRKKWLWEALSRQTHSSRRRQSKITKMGRNIS